jgi:hypothetical protein
MRKERCKNGYSSSSAVGEKKGRKKILFHSISSGEHFMQKIEISSYIQESTHSLELYENIVSCEKSE